MVSASHYRLQFLVVLAEVLIKMNYEIDKHEKVIAATSRANNLLTGCNMHSF
jgi:hypothetical protein